MMKNTNTDETRLADDVATFQVTGSYYGVPFTGSAWNCSGGVTVTLDENITYIGVERDGVFFFTADLQRDDCSIVTVGK